MLFGQLIWKALSCSSFGNPRAPDRLKGNRCQVPPGRENPVQHSTPSDPPLSQDNFSARGIYCGWGKVQQLSPPYIVHSHLVVSSRADYYVARQFSKEVIFTQ